MFKTIQIGNLGDFMDDRQLARLFAPYGPVLRAKLSTFETGENTGVGFVEMANEADGESAIAGLHGRLHEDRVMSVCWSNRITPQEAPEPQMFKSMNMIDPAGQAEAEPERRGLP
jgi:RNA recognition motif-containing protein